MHEIQLFGSFIINCSSHDIPRDSWRGYRKFSLYIYHISQISNTSISLWNISINRYACWYLNTIYRKISIFYANELIKEWLLQMKNYIIPLLIWRGKAYTYIDTFKYFINISFYGRFYVFSICHATSLLYIHPIECTFCIHGCATLFWHGNVQKITVRSFLRFLQSERLT